MSYKSFEDFNEAFIDLAPTARSNLVYRLLNLASQLSSVLTDLPVNWARQYSSIQQLQYDAQGNIQDVTPSEAVTSADYLVSSAKAKFDSVRNDLLSLEKQIAEEVVSVSVMVRQQDCSISTAADGSYSLDISPSNAHNRFVNFTVTDGNLVVVKISDSIPSGYTEVTQANSQSLGFAFCCSGINRSGDDAALSFRIETIKSDGVISYIQAASSDAHSYRVIFGVDSNGDFSADASQRYVTAMVTRKSDLQITESEQSQTVETSVSVEDILDYNDGSEMESVLSGLLN